MAGLAAADDEPRDQVKIGLVDPNLLVIQPYIKHEDVWKGPKDFSGEVRLGWDEKNLYIAVKVTDNDVDAQIALLRTGRLLRVVLRPGRDRAGVGTVSGMGKILQCWFIPPVAGSPQPEFGVFQGADKLVGVRVASKAHGRRVHAGDRPALVECCRVSRRNEARCSVSDMAINDADKDYQDGKEVKSKILWHGGGDAYSTTANYGLWKLE